MRNLGRKVGEKTPLAHSQEALIDNGTILKESIKQTSKNFHEILNSPAENDESKSMSPWRKLCFVLSINLAIFYVIALSFLIPCHDYSCPDFQALWERNVTGISITTNIATLSNPGLSPLILFGYIDEGTGYLMALTTTDGKVAWNVTLNFSPRKILCGSENSRLDVDGDEILDCLIYGLHDIGTFNSSNGYTFWRKHLDLADLKLITLSPITNSSAEQQILAIWTRKSPSMEKETYLSTINAQNGLELHQLKLPIEYSISSVKLISWKSQYDDTYWGLLSSLENKLTEVWAFQGKLLMPVLSSKAKENKDVLENYAGFQTLFRWKEEELSDRSMERALGGDVTIGALTSGMAVSWANTVTMVTTVAQPPYYIEAWKKNFDDRLGSPQTVTGLLTGHFVHTKDIVIAAFVQRDLDAMVYILEVTNGSIISSIPLQKVKVLDMKKVPAKKGNMDSILIDGLRYRMSPDEAKNSSAYDIRLSLKRSFWLIKFKGNKNFEVSNIPFPGRIYDSTLSLHQHGGDLILLSGTPENSVIVIPYNISTEKLQQKICRVS